MSGLAPFSKKIPFKLTDGKVVIVKGCCPEGHSGFGLNLCDGPDEGPNIMLHINPKLWENVVSRRTREDNDWTWCEEEGDCPLKEGKDFEILIHVKNDVFEIFINKKKHSEFKHRLPKENARYVNVTPEVEIYGIEFGEGLAECMAKAQGFAPFSTKIPFTLTEGKVVIVKGNCPAGWSGFGLNLCDGPDEGPNIMLHINPKLWDKVVSRRTRENGDWTWCEEEGKCPLKEGKDFEIIIHVKNDVFEIFINKKKHSDFKHRLPKENANYVCVTPAVEIYSIQFGEGLADCLAESEEDEKKKKKKDKKKDKEKDKEKKDKKKKKKGSESD